MAGEPREDAPAPAGEDPAAEAGRLTGRAFNRLGMRLLRLGPVQRAIRRGAEEASRPDDPSSPAQARAD